MVFGGWMGYIEYNHVSRTRSGLISTRSTRSWPAFSTPENSSEKPRQTYCIKTTAGIVGELNYLPPFSPGTRTHCHASWCVYWCLWCVCAWNVLLLPTWSGMFINYSGFYSAAEGVFLIFDVPPVLPSLTDRTINHLSFFTLDCFILNTPCCTLRSSSSIAPPPH
jgi:hypothetical protein